MIAEIVSNGMLSLPSSLAVVGLVPGIVVIVFLGAFGLFTAWVLIQFKLRHPEGESTFGSLWIQTFPAFLGLWLPRAGRYLGNKSPSTS